MCPPLSEVLMRPQDANVAHVRQSRPDSGLEFQAKVHAICQGVADSFGSDAARRAVHSQCSSWSPPSRCQVNVAHVRHSRPDSSLGSRGKVLNPFKLLSFCPEAETQPPPPSRCQANVPHVRQPRPISGLGFTSIRISKYKVTKRSQNATRNGFVARCVPK